MNKNELKKGDIIKWEEVSLGLSGIVVMETDDFIDLNKKLPLGCDITDGEFFFSIIVEEKRKNKELKKNAG